MTTCGFWVLKRTADGNITTTNLNISKAAMITTETANPTLIKIKTSFSDLEEGVQVNVLKKGKTLADLRQSARIEKLVNYAKKKLCHVVDLNPLKKNQKKQHPRHPEDCGTQVYAYEKLYLGPLKFL
ncbi:hypothetical protein ABEB36_015484 [Hypothenemus hampei]|uniref:Uncharacterized protein n=1 Tax=Hypothenemus hampei TaxID=57062 RepID=A0ABD1E298_HYPHA